MDYRKKKASKKQKDISSNLNMQKKRVGVRFFKGFIICTLILLVLGGVGTGMFFKKIVDKTPKVTPADVKPSEFSTFVYDPNGAQLEKFVSAGSNRVAKPLAEIPINLQHAFIAIEDERFYTHNGVDAQGIARVLVKGVTSGSFSEGASTITQQLIKNTIFTKFMEEKTFYDRLERKVQEQFLAVEIEKQMSKDEILENYMNTINLGQNTLGVQTAAKRYFGKDVKDLTLSECAVIAGITKSPTKYNPVTNPADNEKRRTKVLGDMLKQKYITQQEYDEAKADNVYERIQTNNAAMAANSPYSYFIDALSNDVIEDLQTKLGYSYSQAYNALYSGGLSIYATQDLRMQQIADEELNNPDNYPAQTEVALEYALTIVRGADQSVENYSTEMLGNYLRAARGDDQPLIFSGAEDAQQAIDEYKSTLNIQEGDTLDEKASLAIQPQASLVVMDQTTGYVKAIVGGRGVKEESLSLNRATDTYRQPGSCFKILSTYAPAIDIGKYTLASVIKDEPTTYTDGTPVRNWWGDSYKGNVTVRKAIEQSMNVVTVKTFADITPQVGFNYLKNFGFTTLVESENGYSDIQLPTALGGITHGVINEEMTAAYAAIANNGVYIKPVLYTKILDHDGNVLLDNTPEKHQVLQDSTAALITNAMEDVVTKGTGTRARLSNMPVSGKTGTTSDNKDIWFSGYTPYLTCSVWGGYDTNKELNSTSWHLDLWSSVMERIHEGYEYRDFVIPPSVEKTTICSITGKRAVSSCPGITEYFATGSIPEGVCPGHYVEPTPSAPQENSNSTEPNAPAEPTTPEEPAPAPAPSEPTVP